MEKRAISIEEAYRKAERAKREAKFEEYIRKEFVGQLHKEGVQSLLRMLEYMILQILKEKLVAREV